jgi:O-antigen/teichoic acid export membrane protein
MAEVVSVRIFLFFVAFFTLRPLMLALLPRANRAHGLALLGVSTLIAFVLGALALDDPMGDTVVAWVVIYAIIAALWFARWKGQDYDRPRRTRVEPPAVEPSQGEAD